MDSDAAAQAAGHRAALACRTTADALLRAEIKREGLAEFVPEGKRWLVFPRPASMRPLGEAWRLGTLLLTSDGDLWAGGRATRSAERGRVGYQSLSREERRDIAAAALRGGYPVGEPVNFDATPLPLDPESMSSLGPEAPIGYAGGEIRVRWRAGAPLESAATLERYLRERAELLISPPFA